MINLAGISWTEEVAAGLLPKATRSSTVALVIPVLPMNGTVDSEGVTPLLLSLLWFTFVCKTADSGMPLAVSCPQLEVVKACTAALAVAVDALSTAPLGFASMVD